MFLQNAFKAWVMEFYWNWKIVVLLSFQFGFMNMFYYKQRPIFSINLFEIGFYIEDKAVFQNNTMNLFRNPIINNSYKSVLWKAFLVSNKFVSIAYLLSMWSTPHTFKKHKDFTHPFFQVHSKFILQSVFFCLLQMIL